MVCQSAALSLDRVRRAACGVELAFIMSLRVGLSDMRGHFCYRLWVKCALVLVLEVGMLWVAGGFIDDRG